MKWLVVILVLAVILVAGCTQPTQYVCSDGSTVSNPSLCPKSSCTPNWSCSGWSSCTNGQQTRGCTDINSCGTTASKPIESQACTQQAQTYCGDGICNNGETCQTCPQDCGNCPQLKSSGDYCSSNSECSSGYCVHNYCRNTATYCGDGFCDSGETCSSCPADCGTCDAFTIGDSYASAGNIVKTGNNQFNIPGGLIPTVGTTIPDLTIPLTFNMPTKNVTYNFYCSGTVMGNSFYAESRLDTYYPQQDDYVLYQGNVSMDSYFGYDTANPFILSTGKDFGTQLNYVGKGGVRIILFIDNFPSNTVLNCQFNVVSNDPPFRVTPKITITS